MDGNPEGTPNPLNPVQGVTGVADEPQPSTETTSNTSTAPDMEAATDAGELGYIETVETFTADTDNSANNSIAEEPMETTAVNAVDEYVAVKPASFAEPTKRPVSISDTASNSMATPAGSAMPQMATAPRPVRMNHTVVDPMMRPVTRPNPTAQTVPSRSESNFDTFAMDNEQRDPLAQNIKEVSATEVLVASDSVVEPAKRGGSKKKAFIIGAIVFIMIAIICGAAAIAIVVMSNNDRVGKAIDKFLTGQVSSIIEAKGTISNTSEPADDIETMDDDEVLDDDEIVDDDMEDTNDADDVDCIGPTNGTDCVEVTNDDEFTENYTSSTTIEFDGTIDTVSLMNKLDATLTYTYSNDKEISLDINELTNKTGDTYFKISGLNGLLNTLTTPATSATVGDSETTDTSFVDMATSIYTQLVNQIDNQWILASDGIGEAADNFEFVDNSLVCMVNALSTLPDHSRDLATKYRANPFITSSKDNLGIKAKKNELYKLGYNREKLTAFANSVADNEFIGALNTCMSDKNEDEYDSAELISNLIEDLFANSSDMYVEIDSNDNITRLYFDTTIEAGGISTDTEADIDISYPSELKIVEPSSYTDLSSVVINMSSGFVVNYAN